MINRFLAWLKSIYIKPATAETPTPKETIMSEPLVDAAVEQRPVVNQEVNNSDAVLAKLKELVAAAGAQTHAVFDDLVDLAKKLV
ncbi:hypothetical protein [Rahnella sp. ChDrAdgB13]|uniref:hypothetical protein n=1 Tax=Rahnella sp. ChDrAdgB13 TaxID=1850581 RepID=UPI001AD86848|nr:hypothetical protein [Rahnella sp. ChDrAdgB13]